MPRVLVVQDEEAVATSISCALRHHGFDPVWVNHARAAQREVDTVLPEAVILDWVLPGESGFSLLRRWRESVRTRAVPILMLTDRVEEAEVIAALDAGADDYVTRPFSVSELMARIRAVLRRQGPVPGQDEITVGVLVLDPATHRVTYCGHQVKLGPIEFKVLRFLMENPGQIHTRRQLLDGVCGAHALILERAADVHVKRLRFALGEAGNLVETVKGAGYRLSRADGAHRGPASDC